MPESDNSPSHPLHSSAPAHHFRYLVSALLNICGTLQQHAQSFSELPQLREADEITNSREVFEIMFQAIGNITNKVTSDNLSPDTVIEAQLHAVKRDLYAWVTCIGGCVTVLKHLVYQHSNDNQACYASLLASLEKAARAMREVMDEVFKKACLLIADSEIQAIQAR